MDKILSQRKTPTIHTIYAVVAMVDDRETVIRRETPFGTQPLTTDDGRKTLHRKLLNIAKEHGFLNAYIVEFDRSRD